MQVLSFIDIKKWLFMKILNKIKKVELLVDMDTTNTFTKTNFYMTFFIEDVLTHLKLCVIGGSYEWIFTHLM